MVLAVLAGGAASSDIYITGKVIARVPGKNMAAVRVAWDYKCLGEDGGDYEWNLSSSACGRCPSRRSRWARALRKGASR